MINVTRTIHPVGQGLFCTEKFYNDEQQSLFNIVYDCGSFQHDELSAQINNAFADGATIDAVFISHIHFDHISGLQELSQRYHINSVVMPQLPDNLLIEAFVYNCVHAPNNYVDVNQFIYRLVFNDSGLHCVFVEQSENAAERNKTNIDIANLIHHNRLGFSDNIVIPDNNAPIWEYVPYNMISNADAENLVRALSQDSMFAPFFNGIQITDINGFLQQISNQDGRIHCREIYQRCIRRYSANEYSMPVYSGHVMNAPMHIDCFIDYSCDERCETPCHIHCFNHCHPHCHICCDMDCCAPDPDSGSLANCLYTGDFNASSQNPYYNSMVQFYHHNHRWERIKMIQVPHHGSKHSHNTDLYKERCFAFISCGLRNQYHHPHVECVAGIITTGCHCSIVNEYCQPLKIEMHIH